MFAKKSLYEILKIEGYNNALSFLDREKNVEEKDEFFKKVITGKYDTINAAYLLWTIGRVDTEYLTKNYDKISNAEIKRSLSDVIKDKETYELREFIIQE